MVYSESLKKDIPLPFKSGPEELAQRVSELEYDLQGNVLYLNPSFTRSFSLF